MSENNIKNITVKKIIVKHTTLTRRIDPLEIAKAFNTIPMGQIDYYSAKTLYHTPGFKEQKQKKMDEYFIKKNKDRK